MNLLIAKNGVFKFRKKNCLQETTQNDRKNLSNKKNKLFIFK